MDLSKMWQGNGDVTLNAAFSTGLGLAIAHAGVAYFSNVSPFLVQMASTALSAIVAGALGFLIKKFMGWLWIKFRKKPTPE